MLTELITAVVFNKGASSISPVHPNELLKYQGNALSFRSRCYGSESVCHTIKICSYN